MTDDRGRYTFSAADASVLVVAGRPGATTVERDVPVASEVGTVVLDARLTSLAPPVEVGATGGSVTAPSPQSRLPAGALAQADYRPP